MPGRQQHAARATATCLTPRSSRSPTPTTSSTPTPVTRRAPRALSRRRSGATPPITTASIPNHIAPLSQYYTDVKNNTLPAFAFIESGSGRNDEHPGSGQSILIGQAEVAKIVNALMVSPSWGSSAFFFSYDEGGGPYDHVPPVPGHSNDFTDSSLGSIPDISSIAVNPDSYNPCAPSGGSRYAALRPEDEREGSRHGEHGCAGAAGICGTTRIPLAQLRGFAVRAQALCLAHSHGPYGDHQVCGEPVHRKLRAPDRARCRTAEPAGLLRLQRETLGHAAHAAHALPR